MDDDDQVVLAVTGHIVHDGFARFDEIAPAPAEGALLEDRPAVGGNQFAVGVEDDQVEVVPGRLEEDQVLAAIPIQVAGDNISEVAVSNRGFLAVEFGQYPDVAVQGQAGNGI